MNISVCIATYRRPERLLLVLRDLAAQTIGPDEVITVDNDVAGTARAVVEEFRRSSPFPVHYEIQPQRNIALTRNRTVAAAHGDWLAFIDDDERAPSGWLASLIEAAERYQADAVLGPVEPLVPQSAPGWIRQGRFYDFPRMPTGTDVPLNRMRFGSVVLRRSALDGIVGPFDERYGLTTGEDADLLIRMVGRGSRVIWSEESFVNEPIEAARLSLRWLLQRALSGGQEFTRKTLAGRYGKVSLSGRAILFIRSFLQLCVAAVVALATLPAGKHRSVAWLIKAAANLGKLSVFWGWRYNEYA